MLKTQKIDFNKFFLIEFFDRVCDSSKSRISGQEYDSVATLFSNLKAEDDITVGIETLAREHSTSELSIFLFDILERISDYPPILAYDSLPEISEDFVNTLKIMLEEDETLHAINRINSKYKSDAKPIFKVKSELFTRAEEEKLSIDDFIRKEFFEEITLRLSTKLGQERAADLVKFTEIVLNESEENLPENTPELVKNLKENFGKSFSGDSDEIENRKIIASLLPVIIDNLIDIDKDNPNIVDSSIKQNKLIIKEIKRKKVKEEKQPASIESLLSAYFQSEMDEYTIDFRNGLKKLQKNPSDIAVLEFLEKKFHSFKEISMIHGYEIIEMICSRIIALLYQVRTKKYSFLESFFDVASEILDEFQESEKLKGKSKASEEAQQIDSLIDKLEMSVDKTEPVEEKESERDEVQEQPVDTETIELIHYDDKEKIITIFKDVVNDLFELLKSELPDHKKSEAAKFHFERINRSAQLLELDSLKSFCSEYAIKMENLKSIDENKYSLAGTELANILEEVTGKISVDFNNEDWENSFASFDFYLEPKFTCQESSSILMDIENLNLERFKENLQKIIEDQDNNIKENQRKHFARLRENLKLFDAADLVKFADKYQEFFDYRIENAFTENDFTELEKHYKLFIERVQESGYDANIEDLLIELENLKKPPADDEGEKESIGVKESAIDKEQKEPEVVEKPAIDEEEDLDQIFKDESKNFLWKMEDALSLLETDFSNKDLLNEIEKNAHSLKSSARLMGKDKVAEISAIIESFAEHYLSQNIDLEADIVPVLKNSVSGLKLFIDEKIDQLDDIESELKIAQKGLSQEQTPQIIEKEPEPASKEKPVFAGEDDDDMLEIFKDESSNFITIIENTINSFKEGEQSTEALHNFENASHSLKSAAKMLGFREIGQIADGLEQIAESLNSNEIVYDEGIHGILARAIGNVKELADGTKLSSSTIADTLNQLEIHGIIERQGERILKSDEVERIELDPMVDLFLKEAWELLEKINHDLVELEKKYDVELINNLNRNVHTLKGSAQMIQYDKIGKIAHAIEDFFEIQQSAEKSLPVGTLDPIFKGIDEIQELVESVKNGEGEVSSNFEEVMANLGILTQPELEPESESEPDSETLSVIKGPGKPVIPDVSETIEYKTPISPVDESQQEVKISTGRLDNLINMAAELVINKTQLLNYIESLKKLGIDLDKDRDLLKNTDYTLDDFIIKNKRIENELEDSLESNDYEDESYNDLSSVSSNFKQTLSIFDSVSSKFNSLTQSFEQNISRISHLIKMLHDDILQVRMLPVENLFNRFPRPVRDLSHQQGKKVNLIIEGEKTEMDRAMIESLTDPIMHLIRNAIDHGIETPEERKASGKDVNATIFLRAHQDKNQIIIEVQDDGKGIDLEAIKHKINEKNLVDDDQLEKMSKAEILDYIFYAGFSTRDETSTVSGRGIGLDVVADHVQKLKGDIRVNSKPGKGTIFSIRVPLTLIISQVLLFKLADQIMAIPLISVDETVQIEMDKITLKEDKRFITVRDESIPVFDLGELLKFSERKTSGSAQAIIIQETGIRYAIIVDEVIRREEIVIKSLGDHLQNLEYISGGTILGDGSIALIIDSTALVRKVEREYQKFPQELSRIPGKQAKSITEKELPDQNVSVDVPIDKQKISDRKPIALIVDDSISVRRFVASVLEKNNYQTILASNGVDALDCLEQSSFDIIVTDLEMPKMHGFELIEKIRAQEKYAKLPIVILTGRAGKKHKDMGVELGANAFIVKPFKETDLLKTLKKFIVH